MIESKLNLSHPIDLSIPHGYETTFKALIEMMERPFAALGKKPRFKPIHYKTNNIEILITSPQPWGIATIYDMDIMIWFASRITDKLNRGEEISSVIEFTPYDCLKSLGRPVGGINYKRFEAALNRLLYTHIITTIRKKDQFLINGITYNRKIEEREGFHWIEKITTMKEETTLGKEIVKGIKVVLPSWFLLGLLKSHSVLQLAVDYFDLKKGLDRALYLIARKHVGRQNWWAVDMKILYEKTGSDQRFSDFARDVRKAVERNILPEYVMKITRKNGKETVHFFYRHNLDPMNKHWEAKRLKGRLVSE